MAAAKSGKKFAAIVLAAGQGKRMKSDLPKVLHPLQGRPLVAWVIDAAREAGAERIVVIVGHGKEQVEAALPQGVESAEQAERLGTGHAARCAEARLKGYAGPVVVLSGDVPLLPAKDLKALLARQAEKDAAAVVLTARVEGEHAYGRIVRDAGGKFRRIVEHKDATPDERRIAEINTGTYAFGPGKLFPALAALKNENAQGEYYLTDTIGHFVSQGMAVEALQAPDAQACMGINTPEELAAAERAVAGRR
ncbi:MAG: NTP transferase domain-containing protein [Planctomycetes bacterium]|nr:NTP transferase domain-containing protein [Planctomycetota bacterium]